MCEGGIWLIMSAFESVVHMGEETRDAKRAVPRAVFWSVATNIALGLVMIITFGVSSYLSLYLLSSFKTCTRSPERAVL